MTRTRVPLAAVALSVALTSMLTACTDDPESEVDRAQARVDKAKSDLADAKDAATDATDDFCGQTAEYVTALDRYGDLLHASTPTVGDVRTAGEDLAAPADDVVASAQAAVDARDAVTAAEEDLATAKDALAAAKGNKPPDEPSSAATELVPQPAEATVNRIKQAEADLDAAVEGISDETPLAQGSQQLNSAAVAVELSWLELFAEVGCLDTEQEQQAQEAVSAYTSTLQTSLKDAGYYAGEVDGVYGPATVDAVEALQEANGLPVTGAVDKATAAALTTELTAQGGEAAVQAVASTAAVQQTLTLAGYWTGPVDGEWTPELTAALETLQTDLGVKPTGTVDAATIAAVEDAIASLPEPAEEPSAVPEESEEPAEEADPSGSPTE
jgi:peptidoglycan hydrolase-like protein with peptidoglycan-binding domain